MRRLFDTVKYALIDRKLQREVKERYYSSREFAALDRALLTAYIFKNPYIISKKYLQNRQEKELHTYGETPLTTYETIAKEVDIQPTDTFLELGSGRGRGALFLHHFYKCKVIGIERVPQFIKLARHLAHKYQLKEASFICGDMFQTKLPQEATTIYLYGSNLADSEITQLVTRLKEIPLGTKIVTISYPLTDYDSRVFKLEKTFPVSFPWGETEAYLQTRNVYE
ncbi:SAM-dependent methyltransferase [Candidatus Neptunochlamydia vexilliferae]|uniref:DOT1 domain-containing protein n=1 Tax=Candidatus Neptunichlamydia vexilliferae TaxID=1651774 RepID=A0ABS0B1C5_9BACT|nr:class I SAM-dependent methyltransferase [Candidatus Neptunochlamydia vexilliferae]MBF5060193.1 hypothetical protein [Candidatus Neptunochlamydia vexilliferae]